MSRGREMKTLETTWFHTKTKGYNIILILLFVSIHNFGL